MFTTTTTKTTTTTHDRGYRYGPIEWAQNTVEKHKLFPGKRLTVSVEWALSARRFYVVF